MPMQSEQQRKAMYAAAAGHSNIGIPQNIGREFVASDRPGKLPARVTHAYGGDADNVIDIATHVARQGLQGGGFGGFGAENPWWERAEARAEERPTYGFSMGTGGGRTDKNNVSVGAGSYVLPADVVSGLGEGNSMAGAAVIDRMLRTMPYGIQPEAGSRHGMGIPHAPAPFHESGVPVGERAKGGSASGQDKGHVPIAAADGEIILHPQQVYTVGATYFPHGKRRSHDAIMAHGHDVLDAFVKHVRGQTIEDLENLPGPQNSKKPHEGYKRAA